jgi:hypothetical protein
VTVAAKSVARITLEAKIPPPFLAIVMEPPEAIETSPDIPAPITST